MYLGIGSSVSLCPGVEIHYILLRLGYGKVPKRAVLLCGEGTFGGSTL